MSVGKKQVKTSQKPKKRGWAKGGRDMEQNSNNRPLKASRTQNESMWGSSREREDSLPAGNEVGRTRH